MTNKAKDKLSDVLKSLSKEQQDDIKGQISQEELDQLMKDFPSGEERSDELEKF